MVFLPYAFCVDNVYMDFFDVSGAEIRFERDGWLVVTSGARIDVRSNITIPTSIYCLGG